MDIQKFMKRKSISDKRSVENNLDKIFQKWVMFQKWDQHRQENRKHIYR